MTEVWDEVKYFFDVLWGDTWTGMYSVGRYLLLLLAALIVGAVLFGISGWISDRRFIASCHARGGHVHYKYRTVPGIGVIVGNVVVPTTTTLRRMTFAPGKQKNCPRCR